MAAATWSVNYHRLWGGNGVVCFLWMNELQKILYQHLCSDLANNGPWLQIHLWLPLPPPLPSCFTFLQHYCLCQWVISLCDISSEQIVSVESYWFLVGVQAWFDPEPTYLSFKQSMASIELSSNPVFQMKQFFSCQLLSLHLYIAIRALWAEWSWPGLQGSTVSVVLKICSASLPMLHFDFLVAACSLTQNMFLLWCLAGYKSALLKENTH